MCVVVVCACVCGVVDVSVLLLCCVLFVLCYLCVLSLCLFVGCWVSSGKCNVSCACGVGVGVRFC